MSQLLYKVGIFSISVLFIQQKSSNLYNEFIIKGQKKRPGTLSRPLHILYHYTNIIPQNSFFVYTFCSFFMFLYTSQSIATSNFVILLAIANNTIKKACQMAGLFLCLFYCAGSGATSFHLSLAPGGSRTALVFLLALVLSKHQN